MATGNMPFSWSAVASPLPTYLKMMEELRRDTKIVANDRKDDDVSAQLKTSTERTKRIIALVSSALSNTNVSSMSDTEFDNFIGTLSNVIKTREVKCTVKAEEPVVRSSERKRKMPKWQEDYQKY